ncbi:MAG TPA: 4-oxalomesaconate tautomerase [Paracoccaceae bacterium]|nr:4-oxalomesaconate tautomerase [Paracoccaceae bacterium]
MTQRPIPYLFIRGGTSRGPYFLRSDLPEDRAHLSRILISVMGAGNKRTIDGLGGGVEVTTKVAMLSRSADPKADVDYFFAQVGVEKAQVDYKPTCGNILVGVGPAAIEMGLVQATDPETRVRIRAVNSGALVEAIVRTPGGRVEYEGEVAIDGVPGTAAPVALDFLDVVGSKSGGVMFPTGHRREVIQGTEVTCIDVAMPMVIGRAADFGITGYETVEELDANRDLFARMEAIRLEGALRMGMGDVRESVSPKFGLIARPRDGGHFSARYFMPWTAHPTLAVTGSQCLAACALAPETVAEGLVAPVSASPVTMMIEHPMGQMDVTVKYTRTNDRFDFHSAGVVRTARLIARGEVMVPSSVDAGGAG